VNENEEIDAYEPSVILASRSREESLRLVEKMRGITSGLPSGTEILLEDRRREREQEMADGW
jgi:hypothetical protein